MYYDLRKSGLRIKELRRMYGYTQEELAEKLGVSRGHLASAETGAKGFSIDVLVIIASLFHVSLDYLILGKEQGNEVLKGQLHFVIEILSLIEKEL